MSKSVESLVRAYLSARDQGRQLDAMEWTGLCLYLHASSAERALAFIERHLADVALWSAARDELQQILCAHEREARIIGSTTGRARSTSAASAATWRLTKRRPEMKTLTEYRNEIADGLKLNGVKLDEDDRSLLFNELAKFRDETYRDAAGVVDSEPVETWTTEDRVGDVVEHMQDIKKSIAKAIVARTSENV